MRIVGSAAVTWLAAMPTLEDLSTDSIGPVILMAGGLATLLLMLISLLPSGGGGGHASQGPDEMPRVTVGQSRRTHSGGGQATANARETADDAFVQGREAGQEARPRDMDEVLAEVAKAGLGQPQIIEHRQDLTRLRLWECSGCVAGGDNGHRGPCLFEAGYLEGAMGSAVGGDVVVRETVCARNGGITCEFTIWH